MSIVIANQPTVDQSGNNTANRRDDEELNERFAQYMTVLKSSQLTEVQQKQMQKLTADDERNKVIEETSKDEDDEMKSRDDVKDNGYTVAEMRRGLDLLAKSDALSAERRTQGGEGESQNVSIVGKNFSANGAGKNSMLNSSATTDFSGEPHGNAMPGVTSAQVLQESINVAIAQADMQQQNQRNANISVINNANVANGVSQNGNGSNSRESTSDRMIAHMAQMNGKVSEMSNGKTSGVLLAGMVQVNQSESTKIDAELETKTASILKQIGESKEKNRNTLTKEALTATSNTQQTSSHDDAQQKPSKEIAATQMLPNTSLSERVDQAQLTQRVASVFRSFANQGGTIRMKLHPEELGALTIRMQIEQGKVAAKLETESETTKQILLKNIDTLKQKLKDQNLEITEFEIDVQPNTDAASKSGTTQKSEMTSKNTSQRQSIRLPHQRENERVDVLG